MAGPWDSGIVDGQCLWFHEYRYGTEAPLDYQEFLVSDNPELNFCNAVRLPP